MRSTADLSPVTRHPTPVTHVKASRELGMKEGSCGSRLAGNRLGGAEASLLAVTARRRDGDVARCSDRAIMRPSAPPRIRILYGCAEASSGA